MALKSNSPNNPQDKRQAKARDILMPLLGAVMMVVAAYQAYLHWSDIMKSVEGLGFAGYLLFVAAWVLLASACFPVSVFGVSAGALFGLLPGVLIIFSASMIAAGFMFALARGVLRQPVARFVASRPKLVAIDRMVGKKALRLNFLTRLSPLNFGLACYTLAAGRSSLRDYLIGNLATLPSMFFQVWLGTLVVTASEGTGGDGETRRNLLLGAAGSLFALILVWQITRLVRQALAEEAHSTITESNDD